MVSRPTYGIASMDAFMVKLEDLSKSAIQGYWRRMYSDRELQMYCPECENIQEDILDVYYFEDDAAEEYHPATIVLFTNNHIYVKTCESMYSFIWNDAEAAYRYVKLVTKI